MKSPTSELPNNSKLYRLYALLHLGHSYQAARYASLVQNYSYDPEILFRSHLPKDARKILVSRK